jgi:hypothetical protein
MNLLRPQNEQIKISKTDLEQLLKRDIEQDKIQDSDHYEMLNFIGKYFSGYVSYLDRSDDASQFAQTHIDYIDTDMTPTQELTLKKRLGLRENEKPTSYSTKPPVAKKGDVAKTIKDILSDEDYVVYYNLILAKTSNSIPDSEYINEIKRLFVNYPDVINLHLVGR